jgi:uncharacterized Fe-S center protein
MKVYFTPASMSSGTESVSSRARLLLERLVRDEGAGIDRDIALKVHFGERGNVTFIRPENLEGAIGFLKEKGASPVFMETNALYRGSRTVASEHAMLAREHGFTMLPVIIADGEMGNDYEETGIEGKHFSKCKVGKGIAERKQLLIVSHFKNHVLAGFGGAIKQLGMGCASRTGKLEQHSRSRPKLEPSKCRKCKTCVNNCPAGAISIGEVSSIDPDRCIGCAACIAVCPHGAMGIDWFSTKPGEFREKLTEYALAAQKGKPNIYLTFALNITDECDCIGNRMEPITADLGIFASMDPVAIDKACMDMLDKREGKPLFQGREAFDHAEKIGLGKKDYELVKV